MPGHFKELMTRMARLLDKAHGTELDAFRICIRSNFADGKLYGINGTLMQYCT